MRGTLDNINTLFNGFSGIYLLKLQIFNDNSGGADGAFPSGVVSVAGLQPHLVNSVDLTGPDSAAGG